MSRKTQWVHRVISHTETPRGGATCHTPNDLIGEDLTKYWYPGAPYDPPVILRLGFEEPVYATALCLQDMHSHMSSGLFAPTKILVRDAESDSDEMICVWEAPPVEDESDFSQFGAVTYLCGQKLVPIEFEPSKSGEILTNEVELQLGLGTSHHCHQGTLKGRISPKLDRIQLVGWSAETTNDGE